MFRDNSLEIDFSNLDSINLKDALKEIEQVDLDTTPLCATPKGIKTSCINNRLTFDFLSTANREDDAKLDNFKCFSDPQTVNAQLNSLIKNADSVINDDCLQEQSNPQSEDNAISSFASSNSSDSDNKVYKQNQRDGVVNKTVLRAVRRLFLNMFKRNNPHLVRKRFANVRSSEFFEALWNLIKMNILSKLKSEIKSANNVLSHSKYAFNLSELNEHQSDCTNLTIFMFRFIGFKPKDHVKYNKVIEAKGDLIQTCMYKYSQQKFKKLSKLIEFKILYQFAYFNHLDSMFETDSLLNSNRDEHLTAFERINDLVMNGSK